MLLVVVWLQILRQLRGTHGGPLPVGDQTAARAGRDDLPCRVQPPALLQHLPRRSLPRLSLYRTTRRPRRHELLSHPSHKVTN